MSKQNQCKMQVRNNEAKWIVWPCWVLLCLSMIFHTHLSTWDSGDFSVQFPVTFEFAIQLKAVETLILSCKDVRWALAVCAVQFATCPAKVGHRAILIYLEVALLHAVNNVHFRIFSTPVVEGSALPNLCDTSSQTRWWHSFIGTSDLHTSVNWWDALRWRNVLRSYQITTQMTVSTLWYIASAQVWKYNLVDPASSHMLVSKIKPCMSKYKFCTAKLWMAHYNSY